MRYLAVILCVGFAGCSIPAAVQWTSPPCRLVAANAEASPCGPYQVTEINTMLRDTARRRTIPIKAYVPASDRPKPIILFSHGFGNSHEGYQYLGRHWASHGYLTIHLAHPGTNRVALLRLSPLSRIGAFFDRKQWRHRVSDLSFVMSSLRSGWLRELHGDPVRLGIAGHSVGAVAAIEAAHTLVPPPTAVIAISPPVVGVLHRRSNDISIGRPTLYMSGSEEGLTYVETATESPSEASDVYVFVIEGADHDTFSDDERPPHPAREEHIELIQEMTTRFWRSFLGGDRQAQERFVRCLTEKGHCLNDRAGPS